MSSLRESKAQLARTVKRPKRHFWNGAEGGERRTVGLVGPNPASLRQASRRQIEGRASLPILTGC